MRSVNGAIGMTGILALCRAAVHCDDDRILIYQNGAAGMGR